MRRRGFLCSAVTSVAAAPFISSPAQGRSASAARKFTMKFGPHDGHFAAHAGKDQAGAEALVAAYRAVEPS